MSTAPAMPADQARPDLAALLAEVLDTLRECRAELAASRLERQAPAVPAASGRQSYTTAEVAKMLGKSEYVVRQWCNLGRVNATKRAERRGGTALWGISADELVRYRDEGLLPIDPSRNLDPSRN